MTNEDYARILNELVDSFRSKLQDPDQSERFDLKEGA